MFIAAVIAAARASAGLYDHAHLWLDVGAQDASFRRADEQFARALHIHLDLWPADHDFGYWNAHLGFYAHAFAASR